MILAIIIMVFTMGISLIAAFRVKSLFRKYSEIPARSGYTGAEAAQRILAAADIRDVEIIEHDGILSDHYDPIHRRLVLSSGVYDSNSIAALGIAAHECGHAIQHKIAYAPLNWRMASVGATTFANQVVTFLPILGMITMGGAHMAAYSNIYLIVMASAWGIIMMFNLVTLPVEFDASRRAKLVLAKMNFISEGEEREGVNKVLNAAGWTYVAAFITAFIYFLWYLLPLLLGGRNRN